MLEAARRLTRPEHNQWGINGAFGHGVFFASVWAAGGEVLSRDGRQTRFAGPEARAP